MEWQFPQVKNAPLEIEISRKYGNLIALLSVILSSDAPKESLYYFKMCQVLVICNNNWQTLMQRWRLSNKDIYELTLYVKKVLVSYYSSKESLPEYKGKFGYLITGISEQICEIEEELLLAVTNY